MKTTHTMAMAVLATAAVLTAVTETAAAAESKITILYDAFGTDAAMKKDWGFSALVEVAGKRILFDTGNDGETFAANVKAKGVDLTNLDFVILSHRHSDHMAGLAHFCCAENKRFRGGLTLCSCKVCQAGPDYEVMKEPDHVEIREAEGIVGVHDGCRDELRTGWRIATEQR